MSPLQNTVCRQLATLGCVFLLVLGTPSLSALQAETGPVSQEQQPKPVALRENLWVLPGGWAALIPPTGAVNACDPITALAPRQKLCLGIDATGGSGDGTERQALLESCVLRVRITCAGQTWTAEDLKPVAVRKIKAQGADMSLAVFQAAGIDASQVAKVEQATSMVSLALFPLAWVSPELSKEEPVDIELELRSKAAVKPLTLKASLRLRPWADWLRDPEDGYQEILKHFNRSQVSLSPAQYLPLLQVISRKQLPSNAPVFGFFVTAFARSPEAVEAALKRYPKLDPQLQLMLLQVLYQAGVDISKGLPSVDPALLNQVRNQTRLPAPEKLPVFADPVQQADFTGLGERMDFCWGAWMASGDPKYLRALVELLSGSKDYAALEDWTKKRGGAKGLNASVLRGLAYKIAGWSLCSFQRSDPLVADWLAYWSKDPQIPELLRREIKALPGNPAFRRDGN